MATLALTVYRALDLGPLPVGAINRTLGTELEPGQVWLSTKAHEHAATDHPDDYPACLPRLADAIASPAFVGQAPEHAGNFILIKRIPATEPGQSVLVAIGLERDRRGDYRVKSFYRITAERLNSFRTKGTVKPVRA